MNTKTIYGMYTSVCVGVIRTHGNIATVFLTLTKVQY